MRQISLLLFTLLAACGGASAPAASKAAAAPHGPEASASPAADGDAAQPPARDDQEALLCEQNCWMTEEGDHDTVVARCEDQCGTAAHGP